MKKIIAAIGVTGLILGVAAGCSSERRVTTTTRETHQTVPTAPVQVEKSTSIHTETRTSE